MRSWLLLPALLVLAASSVVAEPPAAVPAAPANLEGGDPIPNVAGKVEFPWIGKQSIIATSDAFERMVAQVNFSDDSHTALGSVTLDGKGGGSGSFQVKVTDLISGSSGRDEHIRSAGWLDAEKTPDIKLEITKLERAKPTVFKMEGAWTMHGVTKPISTWANVRYLAEMPYLGKDVVRVKATFDVSLKAHGVLNESVGTLAVADAWRVEVVLLGLMTKGS